METIGNAFIPFIGYFALIFVIGLIAPFSLLFYRIGQKLANAMPIILIFLMIVGSEPRRAYLIAFCLICLIGRIFAFIINIIKS